MVLSKRLSIFFLFLVVSFCSFSQLKLDFPQPRGFYNESFNLTITAADSSAIIRYKLDGQEPSLDFCIIYNDAIKVKTTTLLQAISYVSGVDTTKIYTHTYLFLDDVLQQPETIQHWPNNSYSIGASGTARHDYEMAPVIVENSPCIIQGLKDIPIMSIVMSRVDFWEMYEGDSEMETSIELLYPNDTDLNQQDDCGIEGHRHNRLKEALRLSFKKEYGNGTWESDVFKNAVLGSETAVDEFDRIVLRSGNNRAWIRNWNEDRTAFTRDEWFRQSQIKFL